MLDKWLGLTWKKVAAIFAAWVLAVLLHNAIYALFRESFGHGGDEPFFFLLAVVVIPGYFSVCVVYTLVRIVLRRRGSRETIHEDSQR
jgi:hypothetical protein